MPKRKAAKKLPLVMRADDAMPWGVHVGDTLRTIYHTDRDYFNYL